MGDGKLVLDSQLSTDFSPLPSEETENCVSQSDRALCRQVTQRLGISTFPESLFTFPRYHALSLGHYGG